MVHLLEKLVEIDFLTSIVISSQPGVDHGVICVQDLARATDTAIQMMTATLRGREHSLCCGPARSLQALQFVQLDLGQCLLT